MPSAPLPCSSSPKQTRFAGLHLGPKGHSMRTLKTEKCDPQAACISSCCHAPPVRNAPLPFVSDSKQNLSILGFSSSLRSRLAAHNAFALPLRSSPRLISIGQLNASLRLHLRPIYVIVYDVPYSMKAERSYLRGGFTLRCLQRLSRPYVATQLCPWQDNWCTRGMSIPVLSY